MPVNLERRKAVMSRSMKLGHCVCNPQQPCPCEFFIEQNICTCAGEKPPTKAGAVRLTQYVQKTGCASKIGQADLKRILGQLPPVSDPNVLVGAAAGDDAGVYRLDAANNLVLTVDVFTPCVDDPYLFGQIAAANSVSDVYAMGGRPLTALSIVGFPIDELDGSILETILRGGVDKLAEAGCSLIGGHSINDPEIKCGFAVIGLIDPDRIMTRDTARPGDALVLTKPLGTGIVSFAAQIGLLGEPSLNDVGAWMAALNKGAAEAMMRHGAHACTDITGYGLAGHLGEMVRGSGVRAEIDLSAIPVFGAVESCLENDVLPGAIERNQEFAMAWVRVAAAGGERNLAVLYDPQTSGGLLISLPEDAAKALVAELRERGNAAAAIIGRVVEKPAGAPDGEVVVVNAQLANFIGPREKIILESEKSKPVVPEAPQVSSNPQPEEAMSCCSGGAPEPRDVKPAPTITDKESPMEASSLFTDFMKEANKEGLIDKRAKKLMAVALSISQRCKPCLIIHLKTALDMGISKAEIEEAAWLGISFTGCSGMMFYKDVCAEINF